MKWHTALNHRVQLKRINKRRGSRANAAFNLLFPIAGIESISVALLIAHNSRLK